MTKEEMILSEGNMNSRMGILISFAIFFIFFGITLAPCSANPSEYQSHSDNGNSNRENMQVKGGPEDLVWVVQLSDLHFSVHHPERAKDFRDIVGPTLSFIKPSLVFITGDLTDGKSKDLLTTKQDEAEWVEYQNIMHDVVKRSGLNKSAFYDLRGNHDNFAVPVIGGPFDFFSKYSLNGQLKRSGKVNSITVETSKRKLLFVGFDSTMSTGLRGPTNLFGHPTDELLTEISSELSLLDSQSAQPVTKISFGHFPLSFSAASNSGKTLKDVFLKNSLTAYLCGHLHTRFGKNLKRHHESSHYPLYSNRLFQLNAHPIPSENTANSNGETVEEFWEWEMGDWRKSRAMRILAIDRGLISFVDIDFKLGANKIIILPTFPLDSRFTTSFQNHNCHASDPSSCGTVRALVFSASPIVSVVALVYDSSPKRLVVVLETPMTKLVGSRGDLYVAPLNFKAFEDPSPERFLLQIQATDIMGKSTYTERRPFSANGHHARLSWSWKEFLVMGCQWDALYYPVLWSLYYLVFSILLIPKAILSFSKKQYTYKNFKANKSVTNGLAWIFKELYEVPIVWYSMVGYMLYLALCPWFSGQILSEGIERGYMTYRGWVLKINKIGKLEFLGYPDVMVVVLPHLFFVVLPAFTVIMALAAEKGIFHDHLLSVSSKKKDDHVSENKESALMNNCKNRRSEFILHRRWIRKILLVISLIICWGHFKSCRALTKAYEMNPIIHYPVYSLVVPLMLAYTIYKTRRT